MAGTRSTPRLVQCRHIRNTKPFDPDAYDLAFTALLAKPGHLRGENLVQWYLIGLEAPAFVDLEPGDLEGLKEVA